MDITTPTQTSLSALRSEESQNSAAPRGAVRLDAASWIAVAAFVAYIGVGILA